MNGTAEPVRVTHLVVDLHEGGYETLIANMARHFAGSSVILSAISLSGRPGRVGGEIAPLLERYEVLTPASKFSMIHPASIIDAIGRTRADIVHIHSGCWYKGSLAAKRARVPGIVYTEHGREHNDPLYARLIDWRSAKRTDMVITVSDRLAAYVQRALHVPPQRVRTIQNGVDTSLFAPGDKSRALRESLGIPVNALVVGSIGRLDPVKAYERLIDAVAAARHALSGTQPVVGVIWGEGPARAALEAHVAERGLRGAFLLPGWTHDAAECHRMIDVFALTSVSEGASVALMESMSCSAVPLVMNVGANADVLGPELARQVVPAGDVGAFTRALEATLRDDAARADAAAFARRRIIAAYSFDTMAAEHEALYRDLAARGRHRRR